MKVTLRASTGAKILVWRQDDSFYVQLLGSTVDPRICREMELFEAIAELAGLDLEEGSRTAEAMRLAGEAERRLRGAGSEDAEHESGPVGGMGEEGGETSLQMPSRI